MCEDVFYMEEHDFNQEIQLKKRTVYSYYIVKIRSKGKPFAFLYFFAGRKPQKSLPG